MNIERLKELRGHIAALPEEQFDYNHFLVHPDTSIGSRAEDEWCDYDVLPPCGTTGCVAGHCIVRFQLTGGGSMEDAAASYLDLPQTVAHVLFYEGCGTATRKDALCRLDYLIEHQDFDGYAWDSEEGWYPSNNHEFYTEE